jgi:Na+-transporting NADH:ubiquinone oxidoreductase subunit NqrB
MNQKADWQGKALSVLASIGIIPAFALIAQSIPTLTSGAIGITTIGTGLLAILLNGFVIKRAVWSMVIGKWFYLFLAVFLGVVSFLILYLREPILVDSGLLCAYCLAMSLLLQRELP